MEGLELRTQGLFANVLKISSCQSGGALLGLSLKATDPRAPIWACYVAQVQPIITLGVHLYDKSFISICP